MKNVVRICVDSACVQENVTARFGKYSTIDSGEVADLSYVYGKAGDIFVTGDWNSDGWTEIGVVRNNITWMLDMSWNGIYGPGDLTYSSGKTGDIYVTGKWN